MLKIKFVDENIDIKSNLTRTNEIFDQVSLIKNIKREELLLVFNSINISHLCAYSLADIGFTPTDTLKIILNRTKKLCFKILPFNHIIDKEIDMCTNVFCIKKQFANDFFTVPQNIIIKSRKQILSDDILLFNETDQNLQFEVEVEQGYSLYYTFYGQFRFICMSDKSTLEDLQNTLFIYAKDIDTAVFKYFLPVLPKENYKKPLKELSQNIKLFEFYEHWQARENYQYKVEVNVSSGANSISYNIALPYEANIYSLTCHLERIIGIDRDLFTAYNKRNAKINKNIIVDPNENSIINFKILDSLQVNIDNTIENISYITRIYDIKKKYNFAKHNFGIVINNQFVCSKDTNGNEFLTYFLTNSATKVNILFSKRSCHEKKYFLQYESGHLRSTDSYLIPDDMTHSQIAIKYLGVNLDEIKIVSENENGYLYYESAKTRTVHFNFIDEKKQIWPYHFLIDKTEPRIIDLLEILYNYRTIPLPYKNVKYIASFDDKPLKSLTKLRCILYNNTNKIAINEYRTSNEETATLMVFPENNTIKIKISPGDSAEQILKQYSLQDYALFYDYKQLKPSDKPYFCINNESDVLIANKILSENNFRVSNGLLEIAISLKSTDYNLFDYYIKLIFDENIKFRLRRNGDHPLPDDFYPESLPKNPLLIVDYPYHPNYQIRVNHITTKMITIPIDYFSMPISQSKAIIMKEFDIYYYSQKALRLSFNDVILSDERSFIDYKITSKMPLSIRFSQDSFPIEISTFDNIYCKRYHFCQSETIRDLKFHLKEQFDIKGKITIASSDNRSINEQTHLQNKMRLQIKTKEVTVKYQFNQMDKEYHFDGILKVEKVNDYINKKINEGLSYNIYLFTYNEVEKCYEKADIKKRLCDFDQILFAHKILPSFYFAGYAIRFDRNKIVSEQNTLKWFKKEFIANQVLSDPKNFVIMKSDQIVDESNLMKDLCKGIRMKIRFKFNEPDIEEIENDEPKAKKASKNYYKPKIVRVLSSESTPKQSIKTPKNKINFKIINEKIRMNNNNNNKKDDISTPVQKAKINNNNNNKNDILTPVQKAKINNNNNNNIEQKKSKNPTIINFPLSNMDSDSDGSKEQTNNEIEDSSKEQTNNEIKNSSKEQTNDEIKNSSKVQTNNKIDDSLKEQLKKQLISDDSDQSDDYTHPNIGQPISEDENENENDKETKIYIPECNNIYFKKSGDIMLFEEEEEEADGDDNDEAHNKHFGQTYSHIDLEVEEEEEEEEEEESEGFIICKFQISKNEPFELKLKNTDTIEDAKIKISKREGGIDINCISIVFAGKKLKRNLSIKSLKLKGNDILQVFIFKPQTILLKSAKCFSINGTQEFGHDLDSDEDEMVSFNSQ